MSENLPQPLPVDRETWAIAFNPYATPANANSAYDLARVLMEVKRLLDTQPPNVSLAASALDDACEVLFPFTEFHKGGYDLYRIAIEGHPTTAHQNLMESLGIRY